MEQRSIANLTLTLKTKRSILKISVFLSIVEAQFLTPSLFAHSLESPSNQLASSKMSSKSVLMKQRRKRRLLLTLKMTPTTRSNPLKSLISSPQKMVLKSLSPQLLQLQRRSSQVTQYSQRVISSRIAMLARVLLTARLRKQARSILGRESREEQLQRHLQLARERRELLRFMKRRLARS